MYFGCDVPMESEKRQVKLEFRNGDSLSLIRCYLSINVNGQTVTPPSNSKLKIPEMEENTIREYICGSYISFQGDIVLIWTQDNSTENHWYLDDINIRHWDGECFRTMISEDFSGSVMHNYTGGSVSTVPCEENAGNNQVLYFNGSSSETRSLLLALELPSTVGCEDSSAVTYTSEFMGKIQFVCAWG